MLRGQVERFQRRLWNLVLYLVEDMHMYGEQVNTRLMGAHGSTWSSPRLLARFGGGQASVRAKMFLRPEFAVYELFSGKL